MRNVTSIKDPGYALLAKIARQGSQGADSIMLDNVPLLESAVNAGLEILGVMWDERFIGEEYCRSVSSVLESRGVDVMYGTHHLIRRFELSQAQPQVVFAVKVSETPLETPEAMRKCGTRYIALLDVKDPMNVGTILRHAEAFGYRVILAGETGPGISRHVFRSSTGSALRKPIYRFSGDGMAFLQMAEQAGYQVITTSAHASVSITGLKWSRNHIIMVGNESRGLPLDVRHSCPCDVYIPMMSGGVHSINVAAASSISMYTGMLASGDIADE